MDNVGPYLTYAEFIIALKLDGSTVVQDITDITLGALVTDPSGDIFEFTGTTADPQVGDVINQLGRGATIIEILAAPDRVRVDQSPTVLTSIAAKVIRSDSIPLFRGEDAIQISMDFIDEYTGQFFNKRTSVEPFKLEGNNTPLLHFPVPIIEITKLLINSTDQELIEGEENDFFAFKGRARPVDDRRNPRIKLNVGSGRDSIFLSPLTSRVFVKGTLTSIEGSFGFLEPDGTTPALIKRATLLLTAKTLNENLSTVGSSSATGPMKRRKVDLHEREFFEIKDATSKSSLTGIKEVEKIIAKFTTPIRIAGSIPLLSQTRFSTQRVVI